MSGLPGRNDRVSGTETFKVFMKLNSKHGPTGFLKFMSVRAPGFTQGQVGVISHSICKDTLGACFFCFLASVFESQTVNRNGSVSTALSAHEPRHVGRPINPSVPVISLHSVGCTSSSSS